MGHLDVARELVRAGSDLNCVSWDNRTPLHYATGNQHSQVARLLIENGARIDIRNQQGHTALEYLKDAQAAAQLRDLAASRTTTTHSTTSSGGGGGSGGGVGGGVLMVEVPPYGLLLTPAADPCIDKVRHLGEERGSWKLKNIRGEDLTIEYGAVYWNSFHKKWLQRDFGLGEIKVGEKKGIVFNRSVGGQQIKWFATVYSRKNWFNWNTMQWAKLSSLQKTVNISQASIFSFFVIVVFREVGRERSKMMEEACQEFSIVLTIFSFLEVKSMLGSACLVCKHWAEVGEEPLVSPSFHFPPSLPHCCAVVA